MRFRFGDFRWICERSSLPVCQSLKLGTPVCYSRNIGFGRFLLFQPGTLIANLALFLAVLAVDLSAILMTCIMIYHVKSKYTAVGKGLIIHVSRTKRNAHVLLFLPGNHDFGVSPGLQYHPVFESNVSDI